MSDWVSVDDVLPHDGTRVLALIKYQCFYDNVGFVYDTVVREASVGVVPPYKRKRSWTLWDRPDVGRVEVFAHVTHWMPMPEAPEEEDHDNI